ncbi:methyl-accepting chemotaxis protein [Hyalangium rubrum]|uniref:Methyl-accepting chemotaxis protein n=1 Tax=Hyalangium rubrum TaxID=3103134 RepID=A0ABU5H2J1_9BACT|nr:methyl-accepting chemotaxis protein [Hyalangium sp. s54d21]MDY7227690.1 methyl-accepting chemotaxis protein [Hyalangium sp. s54d21]
MRRPLRDELTPGLTPRREPVQRLLRSVEPTGTERVLSLQRKILTGYVLLGAALTCALIILQRFDVRLRVQLPVAIVITLTAAATLPRLLARVNRVRVLSRSAFEISQGDLSKPVDAEPSTPRDEIDELTNAIGRMQENLRELVGKIQDTAKSVADTAIDLQRSAENVNGSTEEVGSSMKKIADGAEAQSQLVSKASTVITSMARSIQRTAASAEDAARTVAETSSAAEDGSKAALLAGEKVKKVFNRIEAASQQVFAFGEKTQEISKIVDAITQVAQQTNLLALNATIEAARAGEYGRGFAVVADEVRKLAESAGRSAEQISRLARDISGQSTAVVSAMKEGIEELSEGREDLTNIVRSMGAITDTVRKGAEKVHLISESAREQLEGREEMVKAIQEISQVAVDNATSTEAIQTVIQEQTSAVARMTMLANELTNTSEELQSVVRSFRLQ